MRQKGPVENPRLVNLLFLIVPTIASMTHPINEYTRSSQNSSVNVYSMFFLLYLFLSF